MSNPITPVPDNVWKFLHDASARVGRMEDERFSQEMHSQIVDFEMSSPIEQLFFVAIQTMARAEWIDLNPEPWELRGEMMPGLGLHIFQQHKVGKYRVDFLIKRVWRDCVDFGQRGQDRSSSVIVELDGHAFHDRDKQQRSYEKARDRFLQREGFKVLHYTGSDVNADPYRIAHEVLDTVGALRFETPYDPANPLGID